ncbi:MAG: DUF4381 domain-containing protein [Halioglobus sp.]|nr:DUF4381 domain-containing protein [Halioglobus sp.]
MNPQDPLANLHPLREPELIGWWPLAPGWWLLLALAILIVAVAIYLARKHYSKNAYRRRALRQLQALLSQYEADGNTGDYLGNVNALLKSVALRAYPGDSVASQHGESWRLFLNRSLPPEAQLPAAFDNAVYQPQAPDIDMMQLHSAALHWIKKHKAAA